jgi:hypothetical protein
MQHRDAFLVRFTRPETGDLTAQPEYGDPFNWEANDGPQWNDLGRIYTHASGEAPDDGLLFVPHYQRHWKPDFQTELDRRGRAVTVPPDDGRPRAGLMVRFSALPPTDCRDLIDRAIWLPSPLTYPNFAVDEVRYEGEGWTQDEGLMGDDVPIIEAAYDPGSNTVTMDGSLVVRWRCTDPEAPVSLYRYMQPWGYGAQVQYDPPLAMDETPLQLTVFVPVPSNVDDLFNPPEYGLPSDRDPEDPLENTEPRVPVRLLCEDEPLVDRSAFTAAFQFSLDPIGRLIVFDDVLTVDQDAVNAWLETLIGEHDEPLEEGDYPITMQVGRVWGAWELAAAHDCTLAGETLRERRMPKVVRFYRRPPGDPLGWADGAVQEMTVGILRLKTDYQFLVLRAEAWNHPEPGVNYAAVAQLVQFIAPEGLDAVSASAAACPNVSWRLDVDSEAGAVVYAEMASASWEAGLYYRQEECLINLGAIVEDLDRKGVDKSLPVHLRVSGYWQRQSGDIGDPPLPTSEMRFSARAYRGGNMLLCRPEDDALCKPDVFVGADGVWSNRVDGQPMEADMLYETVRQIGREVFGCDPGEFVVDVIIDRRSGLVMFTQ